VERVLCAVCSVLCAVCSVLCTVLYALQCCVLCYVRCVVLYAVCCALCYAVQCCVLCSAVLCILQHSSTDRLKLQIRQSYSVGIVPIRYSDWASGEDDAGIDV
jgi:hypothetical protein